MKIWLCDLTHDYQTVAINRMPLGIGMIAAYCHKELGGLIDIRLFKFIADLKAAFEDDQPHVIGFSNFNWNQNLNKHISESIRGLYPSITQVFGGPNPPPRFCDHHIPYDGEFACTELLKGMIDNSTPDRSINYKRVKLDDIPSPYLSGFFDQWFDKLKPVIQLTRGCPFKCAFCTEGNPHWNAISRQDPKVIMAELEYIAERVDSSVDLFISDSNFGMYKEDLDHCKIIAKIQDQYGWPKYIHVATAKDHRERTAECARILGGALRISASVQSTDPKVLKAIFRRNVSMKSLEEMVRLGEGTEANTGSEVILALPEDTLEAHYKTLKDVLGLGVTRIRPYTLMLLPGTELAQDPVKSKYEMVTRYRLIPRCFGEYKWLNGKKIKAAEIEEVCVANKTLSFEDYVEARLFHLTMEIFYTDGVLSDLLHLIRNVIHPFDFLQAIHEAACTTDLKKRYDHFRNETQDELWQSRKQLKEFVDGHLEEYREGQMGANLLFKYKTLAFTQDMETVLTIAYNVAKAFLQEMEKFNRYKVIDFLDTDASFSDRFPLLKNGKKVKFEHSSEQKGIIKRNKELFGEDLVGTSRLLSQVHIKKCFRKGAVT